MVTRDTLIRFLEDTIGRDSIVKALSVDDFPNGIQFVGSHDVNVVTLGVGCNEAFLIEASKRKSTFCIFHHGLDVATWKSRMPLYSQRRLRLIIENRMTIAGFHYTLDTHREIGNNATIIKRLGAEITDTLFDQWGFVADFKTPMQIDDLESTCKDLFNHQIFSTKSGPQHISRIGVVSGGAKPHAAHIAEMEAKGVELFITGESSESIPHRMKESGINYFVCGHYATEVFGVSELGKCIENKYGRLLKVEFIDIPNSL